MQGPGANFNKRYKKFNEARWNSLHKKNPSRLYPEIGFADRGRHSQGYRSPIAHSTFIAFLLSLVISFLILNGKNLGIGGGR